MSMRSFTSARDSDPEFTDPNALLDADPLPFHPPVIFENEQSIRTSKAKGKGKGKASGGRISITRLLSVDEIIDSSAVMSTWTVSRTSVAERDNAIAAELLVYNDSGVMRNRFNGVAHREKLSDQRKLWHMRKTADRNNQITGFEALTTERENGNAEHKESIARQAILEGELKINDLRKDIEEEKVARRDWVTRRGEIKVQLTELRDGPLAGTRINGRRPAHRPTEDPNPAAEAAGLGDVTGPDAEVLETGDEFIGAT
ncbi:hypothetical protein C8R46DRAFT_1230984 [Mycena filopes]|nr:hypothetical protein C8R46DRAFT_1230984 [Mycena filopes]